MHLASWRCRVALYLLTIMFLSKAEALIVYFYEEKFHRATLYAPAAKIIK